MDPTHTVASTRAVHVGSDPDLAAGAVIPPISLSTTYQQSAIVVHKGTHRDALEALLASLESGGSDSLVFSSGSAATSAVVSSLSFVYPGEPIHILCVNDVYGGTHRYLSRVASTLQGISVSTIDLESASPSTLLSALLPTTRPPMLSARSAFRMAVPQDSWLPFCLTPPAKTHSSSPSSLTMPATATSFMRPSTML